MKDEDVMKYVYSGRLILSIKKANLSELEDLNRMFKEPFSLDKDSPWVSADPNVLQECLDALIRARREVGLRQERENVRDGYNGNHQHEILPDKISVSTKLGLLRAKLKERISEVNEAIKKAEEKATPI